METETATVTLSIEPVGSDAAWQVRVANISEGIEYAFLLIMTPYGVVIVPPVDDIDSEVMDYYDVDERWKAAILKVEVGEDKAEEPVMLLLTPMMLWPIGTSSEQKEKRLQEVHGKLIELVRDSEPYTLDGIVRSLTGAYRSMGPTTSLEEELDGDWNPFDTDSGDGSSGSGQDG